MCTWSFASCDARLNGLVLADLANTLHTACGTLPCFKICGSFLVTDEQGGSLRCTEEVVDLLDGSPVTCYETEEPKKRFSASKPNHNNNKSNLV